MAIVTSVVTLMLADGQYELTRWAEELRPLLDAIRSVKSGGQDVTGDRGLSIGPYQISKAYWMDSGMPGNYGNCHGQNYSEFCMIRYWQRWCPNALRDRNYQWLARVHNGGPRGWLRGCTRAYWWKVKKEIRRQRLDKIE